MRLDYCRSLMQSAEALLTDINADKATVDALSEMVLDEKKMYDNLTSLAKAKEWDKLVSAINSRSYCRFSAKRNLDAALKADVKIRRDEAKKTADSVAEKFCCTEACICIKCIITHYNPYVNSLIGGFFMIFPMKPEVEIKSAQERMDELL